MTRLFAGAIAAFALTSPICAQALEFTACSLYQASSGAQVYQVQAMSGERNLRYWVVVEVARNEDWLQGNGDLGRVGNSRKNREIVVASTPGTFPAFFYVLGFSEEYYSEVKNRTANGDWTQWFVTDDDKSMVLFDSRDLDGEGGEFETTEDGSLPLC